MSCFRRRSKKDKLIEMLEHLMMLEGQYQSLVEDLKREKQQRSELEKTQQEESQQQQQQVIQLQTERSALETELLQASGSVTSAQRQLDNTVQEKTDLQEALSETTGKLQKAHEEIQALKEENAEDAIRYMSIVTKLQDEKQVMFDRNQEAMDLMNARIEDANSYVDKLKTQMQEQETEMRTEASQLKATLAQTQKELEEYSANVLKKNSVIAAMEAENTKVKAENNDLKTRILDQESQLENVQAASEKRLLTAQNKYMNEVKALEVVREEAVKEAKRTSDHTIQELKKQLELKDQVVSNLTEDKEKEKQQLAKTQKELEENNANFLKKNSVIAAMEADNAKVKAENNDLKTRILDQESQLENVQAVSEKRLLAAQNKYMNEVEEAVKEAKRTSDYTIQELKKKIELKDKAISKLEESQQKEKEQLARTQKRFKECYANSDRKTSIIAGLEEYIAELKAEKRQMTEQSDVTVEEEYVEEYEEADETTEEWEEERIEMERIQQSHLEEIQRLRQSLESSEKERRELENVAREMLENKYCELTALTEGKKKQELSIKKQVENSSRPISDLDESAKKHIQDLCDLFNYQIQEAKSDAAVKIKQLEARILDQESQLKNVHAASEKRLLTAQNKYMNEVKALEVVREEAVKEAKRTSDHTIQELKKQLELIDQVVSNLTEDKEKEKQQLAKTQKELEENNANFLKKISVIAAMEADNTKVKAENNDLKTKILDQESLAAQNKYMNEVKRQSHLGEIQRLRQSLESSEKERRELENVARELLENKYCELTALTEGKKKQELSIKKQVENSSRPISDLDESAKKHIQDLRDLYNYQIQEAKTDAAVKIKQLEAKILQQQLKNVHASEQDKDVSRC